jgi:fucose permease
MTGFVLCAVGIAIFSVAPRERYVWIGMLMFVAGIAAGTVDGST